MKLGILALVLTGVVSTHAELIVNGGFENNGSNVVQNNGGWILYTTLNGWSASGVTEIQSNGLFGGALAHGGTHWMEMDAHLNSPGSVAIQQTLTTVVGQTYNLSFAFAGRPGYDSTENVLDVGINGSLTRFARNSSADLLNWQVYNIAFTGTGSDLIYFADGGLRTPGINNTLGTLLDDVSVVEAVPEPATLGLFGMGLLALVGFARKRNSRRA
jgi:hypothetical protein